MACDRGRHRTRCGRRGRLGIGGDILKWYVDVLDNGDVAIGVQPHPAERAKATDDGFDTKDAPQVGHVGYTVIH